mmetsp:Transcript_8807/g.16796  ORF Transcript_8807/g.16796 Transcript_8807/m.16796 type:complete len:365 (+) Transcript_8807:98-1192(+)
MEYSACVEEVGGAICNDGQTARDREGLVPWLQRFQQLAESLGHTSLPASGTGSSHAKVDDGCNTKGARGCEDMDLRRCAKLATQLEQIAWELTNTSRMAGLDAHAVSCAVCTHIFFRWVAPMPPAATMTVSAEANLADGELEGKVKVETAATTWSNRAVQVAGRKDEGHEHVDNKHEETADLVPLQQETIAHRHDASKRQEEVASGPSKMDASGNSVLAPITVALVSGELLTIDDLPLDARVHRVVERLWAASPLASGCMYELLDGGSQLRMDEPLRGKVHLTAVVHRDRTQLRPPFQAGDLIQGDIIYASWLEAPYQARVQGFTEAAASINVEWLRPDGTRWDREPGTIPYDSVLQVLRPSPH